MKKNLFSQRTSKVLIISYFFYKDLRSRIASSTAHNLSNDNLLYHNLSESKYLQRYSTNSENSNCFPFYTCQNQPPKSVVFSGFFKRPSLHCQKFLDLSQIFVKMQEVMSTFDIPYENGWFFHKIFGQKVVKVKNLKIKNCRFSGSVKSKSKLFKI